MSRLARALNFNRSYGIDTTNAPIASLTSLIDVTSETGWTNFGSTGTPTFAADAKAFKEGGSLKFDQASAAGSYTVARYKAVSFDLTDAEMFTLAVYLPNGKLSTNTLAIYLSTSGGGFTDYYLLTLGAAATGTAKVGWNVWQWKLSDMNITGSPSISSIARVMFKWNTASSADTIYVGGFYANLRARPKAMIHFDDASDTQVAAAAIAASYGIRCTLNVIPDYVDNPAVYTNRLTQAECQSLYDAGHDICGHHQTDMPTLGLAAATTTLKSIHNWLVRHGFERSKNFFAWPSGEYNGDFIAAAIGAGFTHARAINGITGTADYEDTIASYYHENHCLGPSHNFKINATSAAGKALATLTGYIDTAIANGATICIYMHTVGVGGNMTTADFTSLCEYIATRKTRIDAVSMSDWVNGLTGITPRTASRSAASTRAAATTRSAA